MNAFRDVALSLYSTSHIHDSYILQASMAGPGKAMSRAEASRLQRTIATLLAPTLEAVCSAPSLQVVLELLPSTFNGSQLDHSLLIQSCGRGRLKQTSNATTLKP